MKNNNIKKAANRTKLFSAIGMFTVSAAMLASSTFAWFTMNKEVTVTGMEMKTVVGDNLLIASSTAGTTKSADSAFTNGINQEVYAVLQPVSTINASDDGFYYTYDAKANGSKAADKEDIPYDALTNNTIAINGTNYKGYLDYVFEIKALNSDSASAKELRLTELNLLYDGAQISEHSYRVAIFEQDLSGESYAARGTSANKIFAPNNFAYFDNTAVSGVSAKAAVSPTVNGTTWTKSIAAGADDYTKLTVRLWLEGEDTDCYSTKFVELSKEWTLNLKFNLASGASDTDTAAAVQLIGSTAKAAVTGTTASLSNPGPGETAVSYQWYTDNPGALQDTVVDGQTSDTFSGASGSKVYCVITTAKGTKYRTNTITAS